MSKNKIYTKMLRISPLRRHGLSLRSRPWAS